jgi:hypothetical protein
MQFSDFENIIAAALSGGVILAGYLIQKNIEHKRAISQKRLETYSMFLKSMFEGVESRRTGKSNESDEIFWKSQVSLFGSDNVISKLGNLTVLLPNSTNLPVATGGQIQQAFDQLMLAMRQDIVSSGKATLEELRKISPIIND